jgi:hypothetical protein
VLNRWAVAPGGCKPGVKELALKGPLIPNPDV